MARRGLYGAVVEDLGRGIVHGDLPAGTTLAPDEIGERYGVSRSVVRETLRVLESKGLVAARQNVGTHVLPHEQWHGLDSDVLRWRLSGPDHDRASHELQELRTALEPLVARLAAENATPEHVARLRTAMGDMDEAVAGADPSAILAADIAYHERLFDAAGNAIVRDLSSLVAAALDDQNVAIETHGFSPAALERHRALTEAVASGDPQTAAAISRDVVALTSRLDPSA